jgi:hypothetical protein
MEVATTEAPQSTTPIRSRAGRKKSRRRSTPQTKNTPTKRCRSDDEDEDDYPSIKSTKMFHRWDALGRWDIISCDTYSNLAQVGSPVVQIKQKAVPKGKFQFCCCSGKIEVLNFDEQTGTLEFKFKGSWEFDKYSGTGSIQLDAEQGHNAKMILHPKLSDICTFELKKSSKEFQYIEIIDPSSKWSRR